MFANNMADKKSQRKYQVRKNQQIIENIFLFYKVFIINETKRFSGGSLTNFFMVFRKQKRKKIIRAVLKKFRGNQLLAVYLAFWKIIYHYMNQNY